MKRAVALAFLAMVLSACSEPLEFADWTITVPEGTPIKEYAAVPIERREGEQIALVRDLAIGENEGDSNYIFYRGLHAVMDRQGRVFVQDTGNQRIQVFSRVGEYLMTFGGRGQGPGEFTALDDIAVAGSRVLATDGRAGRHTVWTVDGELMGEFPIRNAAEVPRDAVGLDDGTVVARTNYREEGEDPREPVARHRLVHLSGEMNELHEILRFPPQRTPALVRREASGRVIAMTFLSIPWPEVVFAAAPGGTIYAAVTSEYQVYSLRPDGEMEWALRVAAKRTETTDEQIRTALDEVRQRMGWENAVRSEFPWPELRPAIERIAVDGHGNLYVYPYPDDRDSTVRPVDVYSPQGDRLFAGWISSVRWRSVRDDYLLAWELDEETGEERIVRYRLVEPFE